MNIPPTTKAPGEHGLDFLNQATLNSGDFNARTEFLLDGFLAKRLITLVYADGGNGKSWLGFALAKHCAEQTQRVFYLDFDNPLSVLKERNIHELLVGRFANINYVQRSKCQHTPLEVLAQLSQCAVGNTFEDCVFIVDSLRNFVNVNHEGQAMEAMTQLMNLREAGATVVILHHSNKDGRNYQGSNHIRNSLDNMYQLRKVGDDKGALTLHLTVQKERAAIVDKAFTVDTQTLALVEADITTATMTDEQEDFVDSVKSVLRDHGEAIKLNKTELLEAVGKKKDDKTARGWLDKFDGVYWQSQKANGVYTYALKASA